MIKKSEIPDHIVDTAMRLAGETGWRDLSLGEIAAAAGLPLSVVYEHFASKEAILAAFTARLDQAVLATEFDEEETVRDRLFDAILRRFEAMQQHREAMRRILREAGGDPVAVLAGGPRMLRAMALILEAAGLSTTGLRGVLRIQAMTAIYLYALRAWMTDDSLDMSRTMAAVDKALARAEGLAGLCVPPWRRRRPPPESAPPAPETGPAEA